MRKRLTVVLGLVLVGLLALSSVASALDDGSAPSADVVSAGAGKLAAHGHGHVEVDGSGWVMIRMHGDAIIIAGAGTVITVRAAGDDAADEVTGETTVTLDDFTGVIVVRGSDFHISATGWFPHVFAKGDGVAFLQGRGWYRATGGYFGTWTRPGVSVDYSL